MATLYDKLKEAGVEIDSHESDLYFPVTAETRAILADFPAMQRNATTFQHSRYKTRWYDVPFAFVPWWEKRAHKADSAGLDLADAVLEWAREPRNHGGNPYLYKFVQLARKMRGEL